MWLEYLARNCMNYLEYKANTWLIGTEELAISYTEGAAGRDRSGKEYMESEAREGKEEQMLRP